MNDAKNWTVCLKIIQQDDGWLCCEYDAANGINYRTLHKTKYEAVNYLKNTYYENIDIPSLPTRKIK